MVRLARPSSSRRAGGGRSRRSRQARRAWPGAGRGEAVPAAGLELGAGRPRRFAAPRGPAQAAAQPLARRLRLAARSSATGQSPAYPRRRRAPRRNAPGRPGWRRAGVGSGSAYAHCASGVRQESARHAPPRRGRPPALRHRVRGRARARIRARLAGQGRRALAAHRGERGRARRADLGRRRADRGRRLRRGRALRPRGRRLGRRPAPARAAPPHGRRRRRRAPLGRRRLHRRPRAHRHRLDRREGHLDHRSRPARAPRGRRARLGRHAPRLRRRRRAGRARGRRLRPAGRTFGSASAGSARPASTSRPRPTARAPPGSSPAARAGSTRTSRTSTSSTGDDVHKAGEVPTPRGGVAGFHAPGRGGCVAGGEGTGGTFDEVECVDADGKVSRLPSCGTAGTGSARRSSTASPTRCSAAASPACRSPTWSRRSRSKFGWRAPPRVVGSAQRPRSRRR